MDTLKTSHPHAAEGDETFPEYSPSTGNKRIGSPLMAPGAAKHPTFQCLSVWQRGGAHFLGRLDIVCMYTAIIYHISQNLSITISLATFDASLHNH